MLSDKTHQTARIPHVFHTQVSKAQRCFFFIFLFKVKAAPIDYSKTAFLFYN